MRWGRGSSAGSSAAILSLALAAAVLGADGASSGKAGESRAAPGARARKNLVPNGDFESGGKDGPAGWQRPDGLTSTWVAAPGRKGKCIRIDTDVLSSQFKKREDEMEAARAAGRPAPSPPAKLPAHAPKYDTVAGNEGVHFVSDPIAIDPAKHYLLEVDARVEGAAAPKVWVKGYGRPREGERERELWKKGLDCNGAGKDWRTFRTAFPLSTAIPSAVTQVRIHLYPYWPPAVYWFDDVRLVEVTEEEAKAVAVEKGLAAPDRK